MPVNLQCNDIPLSREEINLLWETTIKKQNHADDIVGVACVTMEAMTALNRDYRQKNKPTNVLTFSYGEGEHDIAVCLEVAGREAAQRGVGDRDYIALLLVHAFLHATGLDHEESKEKEKIMQVAEKVILEQAGFAVNNL